MVVRAPLPSRSGVTGTSRQPRTVRFSSAAMASIRSTATACAVPSAGRKAMPTAYAPASGSSNPATSRRNASGTWDRMPAPSPESGSEPVAPRCSRFRSTVSACSTRVWVASPVRFATKPTPQASFSLRGSYMPCWAGRPSMGDQAVVLGPVAECVDAERIGSPVVVVALVHSRGTTLALCEISCRLHDDLYPANRISVFQHADTARGRKKQEEGNLRSLAARGKGTPRAKVLVRSGHRCPARPRVIPGGHGIETAE